VKSLLQHLALLHVLVQKMHKVMQDGVRRIMRDGVIAKSYGLDEQELGNHDALL